MAWGIIERCYDQSVQYVRDREQFGRPIGAFQAVQLKISDLYLKLRTVENVVYRTAWMQQYGVKDMPFVNASKAMCAQMAVDAALTSIQIHGGYGYMEELRSDREQFGRPIGAFQAVQLKISDLYLKLRTVENVVYRTAWMQQHGVKDMPFVNASKAMCAQMAVDAALTSIQIHGGYGYMEEL